MITYLLFLLVNIILVFTLPLETQLPTPRLANLGQVGGKIFYVENIGRMNWTEARSYCDRLGLALATIDSTEEYDFLRNAHKQDVFDKWYWVAARDSQRMDQLVWEKNGTIRDITVKMEYDVGDSVLFNYLNCGVFVPYAPATARMQLSACSYKDSDRGALCEDTRNQTHTLM